MESLREDGAVISKTCASGDSHLLSDDAEESEDFKEEFAGNTERGCIRKSEELEYSDDDECLSDIAEVFGDDWLGKPGVSSESDSEDLPSDSRPVEPKKKRVRGQPVPSNITFVEGEPVKYKCTVCVKTFNSKGHIRYHAYCGQAEKPFKCNLCSKSFSKKSLLDYHNRTHTGERPYSCNMCDRSFRQLDKLKRHRRVHLGSYLKCDQCDKTFRDSNSLNVHKRLHIDSHLNDFKCETCSKTFKGKSALNKHVRAVHSTSKQFFCEHCGKGFDWKYNLVCHVRTHSGVRAYSCDECNRTFKNQQDCCKHRLTHTEDRDYQCQVCEGAFKRRDNFIRHLRNIHPEVKITKIVKVSSVKPNASSEEKDSSSETSSGIICKDGHGSNIVNGPKKVTSGNSQKADVVNEKGSAVSKIVFSGKSSSKAESNVIQCNMEKVPSEACHTPSDPTRTNSSSIICRESKRIPGESDKIPNDFSRVPTESSKIPYDSNKTTSNIRFIESNRGESKESVVNDYESLNLNISETASVLECPQTSRFHLQPSNSHLFIGELLGSFSASDSYLPSNNESCGSKDLSALNPSHLSLEESDEPPIDHDPSSLNADSNRISVIRNLSPSQINAAQSSVIKHSRNTNSTALLTPPSCNTSILSSRTGQSSTPSSIVVLPNPSSPVSPNTICQPLSSSLTSHSSALDAFRQPSTPTTNPHCSTQSTSLQNVNPNTSSQPLALTRPLPQPMIPPTISSRQSVSPVLIPPALIPPRTIPQPLAPSHTTRECVIKSTKS